MENNFQVMRSIQSLGLPFKTLGGAKTLDGVKDKDLDGARALEGASSFMLPPSFEEQLRKEALAFVSDYCKSHFRNIAEGYFA